MESQCIVYCDESLNDGPNYLNPEQPFYVIAGWVVPDSAMVNASIEIETLRQKHCRDADELSFGIFKRRPRIICESMKRLGAIGLVPVYVIAEKRYCIAGKIVETFLDPFYNPKITNSFTCDLLTKQEIANTLYARLSDEALRKFAEAYRAPTQPDLERALAMIVAECHRSVNPELASLIEGSVPKLAEIADSEIEAVSSWGKAMGTLNLPCLISFLMLIEELGRKKCISTKKIVHDEQGPYQEGYQRAFRHHRDAEDRRVQLEGMRVPYGAIRMIDDFEIQKSVDQPMIQAADLLAGSIAHLAKALLTGRKLHQQEVDLGGLIFPPLLFDDVAIAKPVCSDGMLKRFGDAIRLAYPAIESARESDAANPEFHWTSTLPGDGPLPVLPARLTEQGPRKEPAISVKVDLPIYGICDDDGRFVVMLPPNTAYEDTTGLERCVPLWTRRASAEAFYHEQTWDVAQHLVEFGPKELPQLIARLRKSAEWTEFVRFNMFDDDEAPIPILSLASDLERVSNRIVRAAQSGMLDSLARRETVDGYEIFSVLMSDGTYAAQKMPDGPMANGQTRDEAVAKLMVILRAA